MPKPMVNIDVARLESLLNQHLQDLVQVDPLRSSAADKTLALHCALRLENNNGDYDDNANDEHDVIKIELVKLLLKSGASAKQKLGQSGETALHVAAKHCTESIVLMDLLDAGVILNATTRFDKRTALHVAVEVDNRLAVEKLLSRGVRIDAQNNLGDTALHLAVKLQASEKVVRLLLDKGADPNCQNNAKETPFTSSLGQDGDRVSRLMLSDNAVKPVNVALKNYKGETVLHLAALRCSRVTVFTSLLRLSRSKVANDSLLLFHAIRNPNSTVRMKLVRLLLRYHDADSRLFVDKNNQTLLHLAVQLRAIDVAEYLLNSKKFDVNGKPGRMMPLFSALRNGDEAAVNLLLQHSELRVDLIDRNKSYDQMRSLHAAVEGFKDKAALFRVCKILLDRGAPLDQLDSGKCTALVKVLSQDNERVAHLLISRGANVCMKDINGCSPLHIACIRGHMNIAKKLLDAGANVNESTSLDVSVLEFATYSGSEELVKLMLDYGADCRTDGGALLSVLTSAHPKRIQILKLLLSRGADLNVKVRGKLPLAHELSGAGLPHRESGYIQGILLRYIALDAFRGRPVHPENLNLIRKSVPRKTFYEKCIRELEIMRSTRLCDESPVSYYDLLTKRHNSLVRCLRCEILRTVVDSGAYKLKLELYLNIMDFNCKVGLRRLSMQQNLRVLLQDVLGNQLPRELIEMLCEYFSDRELEAYCCVARV